MIIGLGVDIVLVKKIISIWNNHLLRAIEVVFSPSELQNIGIKKLGEAGFYQKLTSGQARYLATRFAAKEASLKLLKLNSNIKYELSDIEVFGKEALIIHLTGDLERYSSNKGIRRIIGSCSSTRELAIALVIGEG